MKAPGKVYDLSQPTFHNSPQWPEYEPTVVNLRYTLAFNGFNAERVELTTHSGTHMDVPFHFIQDGATIDRMPLERLMGPATILDLTGKAPGSVISAADLERCDEAIAADEIILIKTGWGLKRASSEEYLKKWPYLDQSAAEYLVSRNVRGVGTDGLSIGGIGDYARSRAPHIPLLKAEKFIIEDMLIPDDLAMDKRYFLCAFPILLKGAGAAWVRPVAWELG
jgi:arylformamidase